MCKEADVDRNGDDAPVIPDNLPEATPKEGMPLDHIFLPNHVWQMPEDCDPANMEKIEDIPPSDVQESNRAM